MLTHFINPCLSITVDIWKHLRVFEIINHNSTLWKVKFLCSLDVETSFCTCFFLSCVSRKMIGWYLKTSNLSIANLWWCFRVVVPSVLSQLDNDTTHTLTCKSTIVIYTDITIMAADIDKSLWLDLKRWRRNIRWIRQFSRCCYSAVWRFRICRTCRSCCTFWTYNWRRYWSWCRCSLGTLWSRRRRYRWSTSFCHFTRSCGCWNSWFRSYR